MPRHKRRSGGRMNRQELLQFIREIKADLDCTDSEAAAVAAVAAFEVFRAEQQELAGHVMKQVADAMGTNYVTAFIRAAWQGLKETVTVFEAYLRNQKK